MSIEITPRVVGEVTILEFRGRLTLGEGSRMMREAVSDQLRLGRKLLLLNLAAVRYFDSSGVGELVSAFTTVYNQEGALKLLSPSKRLRDCLHITKLYTVFEVFEDEESAVRSFSQPRYYFSCPVCQNKVYTSGFMPSTCGACDVQYTLSAPEAGSDSIRIVWLNSGSYTQEGATLKEGPPFRLSITGRLNLFSSMALKKVWNVVPRPRRILVDLAGVTGIEDAGRDALLTLIAGSDKDAKIALSLVGPEPRKRFSNQPPFFEDEVSALQWLGDVSDTPRFHVALKPL